MYKLETRDGKLYARKQKRGGGPLGAPEEVDQDWVNSNKDSIFGFDDLQDSDDLILRNAWTGYYNEEAAKENTALNSQIKELQKQLAEKTENPVSLDEPATPEAAPQTQRAPQASTTRQESPASLASPGMNELRTERALPDAQGKRSPNERILENTQADLLNSARRNIKGELEKDRINDEIDEIADFRERDLRRTFNQSPHGAFKYGVKSFDELDEDTQRQLRENYRLNRLRGATKPAEAPTPSAVRQNIPQEDFDAMSDADLERELASGVIGGAVASPRVMPEDLVASDGPGRVAKIQRDLGLPAGQEQSLSWSAKEIAKRDAGNRGFDQDEFYDSLNELGLMSTGPEQSPSWMANEAVILQAQNRPAPAPAPAPAPVATDDITQRYMTNDPDSFSVEESRGPSYRAANSEMPYLAPKETEFKPQVRQPQYDRAKDLSMIQNQTSLDTPAMPKPEFLTRENNAPAQELPPANPFKEERSREMQGPSERMIKDYKSDGSFTMIPYSEARRRAQAYAKNQMKNSPRSLLGDTYSDDMSRLYPTLNTSAIKGQIDRGTIEKFRNNNPFGTAYRPAPREYLGPVATAPTPKTDKMMRDLNAMPKKQQLDVINSFRKHRGEEEILNPFA